MPWRDFSQLNKQVLKVPPQMGRDLGWGGKEGKEVVKQLLKIPRLVGGFRVGWKRGEEFGYLHLINGKLLCFRW